MNTRTYIAKAIQVVIFLFSAFSGFLKNIVPPEETVSGFAVGFASMLSLCVLLFVSFLAHIKLTANQFRTIVLVAAGSADPPAVPGPDRHPPVQGRSLRRSRGSGDTDPHRVPQAQ